MQSGIDDFHAGVPQGMGHDLGPPVMAVQSGLGQENPDAPLLHISPYTDTDSLKGFVHVSGLKSTPALVKGLSESVYIQKSASIALVSLRPITA
jgi:hypothetical protein